METTIVFN